MDPVDPGNSSAAPTGTRPSLFGKSQSPSSSSKPGEAISILSSLDKTAGEKPVRSNTGLPTWFTIAVGSLLGITIAAAVVISLSRDTGLPPPPAKPVTMAHAELQEKAPEAATAPVAGPASSEVNAGATIENAPPAAIAPAAADAGKSQPSPSAVANIATTRTEPAVPAKVESAIPPPTPVAGPAPVVKVVAAEASASTPQKAPAAKIAKAASKDSKPAKKPGTPDDRDASLLAALVAYGEGKPAAEINANAAAIAPPANPKPADGAPTPAQSAQFDPKHDVVVRAPTLSTAELVRRCRTLGFVEGLLCRMRVCSNLWGKDAACPQDAAPSSTSNRPTE